MLKPEPENVTKVAADEEQLLDQTMANVVATDSRKVTNATPRPKCLDDSVLIFLAPYEGPSPLASLRVIVPFGKSAK